MLGFALCGSFCNFKYAFDELEKLVKSGEDVIPIMSYNVYTTDTRFGKAEDFISNAEALCGRKVIHTLEDAEPLGPKIKLDCLCICPCTGNTLAKLSCGICDTPVTLAAKAHMRNERPLVIALASNDGLLGNAENFGRMMARRNVYFVPLRQDDAIGKPRSLVCDFTKLGDTVKLAVKGSQIQPVLI
ncbi:MAG: dipicolinate synthase subunit B [Ruminococcaceae bacterium]|nr:dipicolinate synthase subunit B [Oscillospiraceae bacterium]